MGQGRPHNHRKRRVTVGSVPPNRTELKFSYKYLQPDHPKFPITGCSAEFFAALLARIKYYESMAVEDFVQEDHSDRRHVIVWTNTNVPDGFPNIDPNEVGTDTAWQFCLQDRMDKAHHTWRVHGFLVNDTFYLVWLDPDHRLTATKKK